MWEPDKVLEIVAQARRLEPLVPPDSVLAGPDGFTLCRGRDRGDCSESGEPAKDPERAFLDLAQWTHASPAAIRRARAGVGRIYYLQVFASPDERRALQVAQKITSRELPKSILKGLDGTSESAQQVEVIAGKDASGARVHRVLAGVWLDLVSAQRAQRIVERQTGLKPLLVKREKRAGRTLARSARPRSPRSF